MKLKIAVALRPKANKTNMRSIAVAQGFQAAGHKVDFIERKDGIEDADLMVQTGFARSRAIMDAIEKNVPYIVMEAPFWREVFGVNPDTHSLFGYGGLVNGAFRPPPPDEERPKPELQPLRTEGVTLIAGQKPTDHAQRAGKHIDWLLEKFEQYPDAEFRPHPLMVPKGTLEPIQEQMERVRKLVVFNSTLAAEAVILGCECKPEHWGSPAYEVKDREEWLHDLSWGQFEHTEYQRPSVARFILSGYEEALSRARLGLQEEPRHKVNPQAVCAEYYEKLREVGRGD